MNGRSIGYWATTVLVAIMLVPGGIVQVLRMPENAAGFAHLGYPLYFMVWLGICKLLGGVVLLLPRLPRLKEWAYAGIAIDFTSATVSHAASGDALWHVIAPLVCTAILLTSWALRPADRLLGHIGARPA
jgi:uncharacterized membrane protein YphA (DoxX/SURF4 family)